MSDDLRPRELGEISAGDAVAEYPQVLLGLVELAVVPANDPPPRLVRMGVTGPPVGEFPHAIVKRGARRTPSPMGTNGSGTRPAGTPVTGDGTRALVGVLLHRTLPTEAVSRFRFNNDAGSQYTSVRFTERLLEAGIDASIGTVGDTMTMPSPNPSTGCTRRS